MPSLRKFFTGSVSSFWHPSSIFWFSFAMTMATVYALLAMQVAFDGEYVVQDDARQHVFWMQRFVDSELFPNDRIADYFQSVAPKGYATLYRGASWLGISPLLLHKLLPWALGLVTTAYGFGVSMQILPVPFAGFASMLLLNQCLWLQDGIVSATPKAFVYPVFLAFLYYWLRRNLWLMAVAIAGLGLFYPLYVLIADGVLLLSLFRLHNFQWQWMGTRDRYWLVGVGWLVSFLILLPYAMATSEFGPTVSFETAKTMPEFQPEGRTVFFHNDLGRFWMTGRGGLRLSLEPLLLCLGLLVPWFLQLRRGLPLTNQVRENVHVITHLLLAALGMFFIAHIFLFSLHLPSRYTQHSFRIAIALAAGCAIALLLDGILNWLSQRKQAWLATSSQLSAIVLFAGSILFYPVTLDDFPWTGYVVGKNPQLYEFLQQTPKDTLVASVSVAANNIPTFARRSTLVASEYAIPYHLGYYRPFRQRTEDLIRAQYSRNRAEVKDFVRTYDIDFWLLDRVAFIREYVSQNRWLRQYEKASEDALDSLEKSKPPFLAKWVVPEIPLSKSDRSCMAFENNTLVLLDTSCIFTNTPTSSSRQSVVWSDTSTDESIW